MTKTGVVRSRDRSVPPSGWMGIEGDGRGRDRRDHGRDRSFQHTPHTVLTTRSQQVFVVEPGAQGEGFKGCRFLAPQLGLGFDLRDGCSILMCAADTLHANSRLLGDLFTASAEEWRR